MSVKEKFTKTSIQKLIPKEKRYDVYDTDFNGLFVRVEPSGKKTYILYCKLPNGKYSNRKIGDAAIITPAQARELSARYINDMAISKKDPKEKEKASSTLRMILNEYLKAGGTQSNVDNIVLAFNKFLDLTTEQITLLDVEKSINTIEGKKFSTINRKISSIKAVMNWAKKRKLIASNPIEDLKKLKETDTIEKTRYLTNDEYARLMKAVESRDKMLREKRHSTLAGCHRQYLPNLDNAPFADYFMPLMICALNTGIRKGALFALKWADVDLEKSTITLQAASAKSKKSAVLPINTKVTETLKLWRTQSRGELVFPSPKTGKMLTNCDKAFSYCLKQAGISQFRFHDLRHNFASQLVMRGVDLNTVRELMTHGDIKMTLRYSHLSPEKKKSAVDLLCE